MSEDEIAIIPMVAIDSILSPTPNAATAAFPCNDTILFIYPKTIGFNIIVKEAGKPINNIGFQESIIKEIFLSGHVISFLDIKITSIAIVPKIYDREVAMAAP